MNEIMLSSPDEIVKAPRKDLAIYETEEQAGPSVTYPASQELQILDVVIYASLGIIIYIIVRMFISSLSQKK